MNLKFFNKKVFEDITQDESHECGLASLTMCFKYHKLNVNLEDIRNKYHIPKDGSNLYELAEIAEQEGFISDCYQAELDDLQQLKLPAIIHWDLNHFVVLKDIKNKKYVISDPSIGEIEYTKSEFSNHYTGYCMELTPSANFEEKIKESNNKKSWDILFFIRNVENFKRSFFYISFIMLFIQFISMMIPVFTQVVIDNFIIVNTTDFLVYFILGMSGLIVFRFYAHVLKSWTILFIGYRWHSHFSSYFFKKIMNSRVDFIENRGSTDIWNRFKGLYKLKEAFTDKIIESFIDSIMIFVTSLAMFVYSPKMAFVSVFFFILYMSLRVIFFKKEKMANKKEILSKIKEDHYFLESLKGIESVKLYGSEKDRYSGWKKYYIEATNYSILISKFKMWMSSIQDFVSGLENIALLSIGAFLVIEKEITLGVFFAFFAFREIFSMQGKNLVNNFVEIKLLKIYLERLDDIEKAEKEDNLYPKKDNYKIDIKGDIKLKNIYFKHKGKNEYIFENFSLHIKAGENVVITGRSGKGKTTLMKIIMGLLPIEKGKILIDDVDIKNMGLKHYRKSISAVLQNDRLMTDSIISNITFFSKNIDYNRVIDSAKKSCIHEDIENLNMGYESLVGENGSFLSGGQEQRILLSRALYKKPSILFLDEATSSLDINLEKEVLHNIKLLGMTRISIAHRKDSIENAERVINL